MNTSRVNILVEDLEDNIDDLEEILKPILTQALIYAIESLLFSFLKLHGVDAKEHPVFRELTRVKQYFEKIKVSENGGVAAAQVQPRENLSLDKQAAARIIKNALAANKNIDLQQAEAEARQRLLARRKKAVVEANSTTESPTTNKDSKMDVDADLDISPSEQLIQSLVAAAEAGDVPTTPDTPITPTPAVSVAAQPSQSKTSKKKEKKRKRAEQQAEDQEEGEIPQTKAEKKRLVKKEKRERREAQAASEAASGAPG